MALCCAISNEVPEHPVVSPSSGAIFERRIIEKYILENGVDPISGKELAKEDLIEIKTPPIVKPKPPSATSIPATLKLLQDEWDAVMLYSFTQRQQLQTARQELSHALYQHDAACRAVAAEAGGVANQPTEQAGMSEDSLHSASVPGILALDIHSSDTSKILTGGNDRNATVFNKDTEQVVAILKGHTKKVTKVIYHPDEDLVITASPDSTIRIWNVPTSQTTLLLKCHDSAVTGLSLHPTGDYVLSTSEDQHWAFSDIRTGELLTKVADQTNVALTTAQFHPDGLIFGTGTADSQMKIWDLKEQRNVANFTGHTGAITSISFSENGYYLATAADDACIKLWDLRRLKNFKTIQLDEGYQIKDLCFDQSGTYLAVAGTDVRVYLCKQWQELKVFNDHTATATGVRFGKHAHFIASTSMDRTLKLYGLQ
ncbi:pre-mrna-processing factor 19 [Holotrichia oblita]|uniref:Pre-mrna-processing factor 19 n=1 Tax=Holotrichia oblita TaxID=644536 RepID=A0ACB9T1V5_HOLOL|nr:pre-mrna-processing factor 19 [Holotrichia oblita]